MEIEADYSLEEKRRGERREERGERREERGEMNSE
jgi:hypothetical protein